MPDPVSLFTCTPHPPSASKLVMTTSSELFAVPGYQIKLLQEKDLAAIQNLVERCADYERLITGLPPDASSAQKILVDLPEEKSRVDKLVIGIYAGSIDLVGILDLIRDYPRKGDWWLGLLLLDPDYRNKGLGKRIYWTFEAWAARWGAQSIYAGVIEENERAYKFWQGLGFETVDVRPARRFGTLEQVVLVLCREVNITNLETKRLPSRLDAIAPDGSEIRLLANVSRGSMVHCTLPPGSASKAVSHRTVEELWYFISGQGQMWRKLGDHEEVVEVGPGVSLNVPTGTIFQFRNTGEEGLCFVIVTMPPWPGEAEAVRHAGYWK